uniref:MRH domain-containing protein n=1 Tax=Rhabditophanes sp. KR3021 TaxID=114890 RepID=A0AC35TIB7_9BILA
MPDLDEKSTEIDTTATIISPAELISPLIKEKICSVLLDIYWAYQVCHGRQITQFHQDAKGGERKEFSLGSIVFQTPKEQSFDITNPPSKFINDREQVYYPIAYHSGAICDLTGKPRNTTVLYICAPGMKHMIISQQEVTSCQYEIVVGTEYLCTHPSFTSHIVKENPINCYLSKPADRSSPVPIKVVEQKLKMAGAKDDQVAYIMTKDKSAEIKVIDAKGKEYGYTIKEDGTKIKLEVNERTVKMLKDTLVTKSTLADKKVPHSEKKDIGNAQYNEIKAYDRMEFAHYYQKYSVIQETLARFDEPTQFEAFKFVKEFDKIKPIIFLSEQEQWETALIALRVIIMNRQKSALMGENMCVFGGNDYWMTFFCLDDMVAQIHGSPFDGDYQKLSLGTFIPKIHDEWLKANPSKNPVIVDGKVVQVSQFYGEGDVCEGTGDERQTEVRIRCVSDYSDKNGNEVGLFLEEVEECKYVLNVLSKRFCGNLEPFKNTGYYRLTPTESQSKITEHNVEDIQNFFERYSQIKHDRQNIDKIQESQSDAPRSYTKSEEEQTKDLHERIHEEL